MSAVAYRCNLEHRCFVDHELRRTAEQLLAGEIGVIVASRAFCALRLEVANVWPELAEALMTFVAINSQTDALPLGSVREAWSSASLAREDRKVAQAENEYRESARQASRKVLHLLDGPRPSP